MAWSTSSLHAFQKVAFGTPKGVIERVTQLREELSWRRGACVSSPTR